VVRSKSRWILVLAALLPVAACDVDRTEDNALPEAESSRLPGYEVTIPDGDVDGDGENR